MNPIINEPRETIGTSDSERIPPQCGYLKDMGRGEGICSLVESTENNHVCALQRGLECGMVTGGRK